MPVKVITSTIPLGESFPDHMEKQKVDNTRDLKTISGSYQITKSMINDDNNNNNNNYNRLNNRVQENKKSDNEIKSDTTKLTNNTYNASQNKQRKFLWMEFETPLIWLNIISILGFHLVAAWGFICFPYISRFPISLYTVLWAVVTGGLAGFGVTGGAHRLWAHRAYKAKTPLRIILVCCYAMAGQNRLYDWVRDHRVHHKFSETDADPHNAQRGFFFAHVGWLMMRKHPDVIQRGQQVDMSDILEDPVVQFFEKYFLPMKFLFCFILPSAVPVYLWEETWYFGIFSQAIVRYVMSLNFTWLVNSAAHIWGNKPYDKRISPTQNLSVSIVAMGEGWHNYHHVFPWDYKAAELGNYRVNVTTFWLDQFAKIGWAYDLKEPSKELIQKIVENNGDGSHGIYGDQEVPLPSSPDNYQAIKKAY